MLNRLCRLLERVPGPANWTLVIKLIILQSSNYKTLLRQCLSNTVNLQSSSTYSGNKDKRSHQRSRESKRERKRAPTTHGRSDYGPLVQVVTLGKVARFHYKLVMIMYFYYLLKSSLLKAVDGDGNGGVHKFQSLNCFILGRFRFFGRANKISGQIEIIFLIVLITYRWLITTHVPKFKFFAFEFLLSSYEDVLANELRANSDRPAMITASSNSGSLDRLMSVQGYRLREQRQQAAHLRDFDFAGRKMSREINVSFQVNSIFYLRTFNSSTSKSEDKWILRLNRTSESYRALSLSCKLMLYTSAVTLIGWFLVLVYAHAGSVLTNLGFEMSYSPCVAWLRDIQLAAVSSARDKLGTDKQADENNNYSYIYVAPQVIAHEIRIDDIPARIPLNALDLQSLSMYNSVRMFADIIDNFILYYEFILSFLGLGWIFLINSIDIVLNAIAIKKHLLRLIKKLANRQYLSQLREDKIRWYAKLIERQPPVADGRATAAAATSVVYTEDCFNDELYERSFRDTQEEQVLNREEIADLQAILADHFDTITRGSSRFFSFTAVIIVFIWLSYTVAMCSWISVTRSRAIEFEFLCAEIGGTLFALILLSVPAIVRAHNRQLYPLITQAMALDTDWTGTKPRWITILGYFYPKPLYCFTIIGSTEVSWLLSFKLIAWILSAFVVLANFYYSIRM